MRVRQALLEDAVGIADLYGSLVEHWLRRSPSGEVQQAEFHELSLYEQWLHGGPWYSVTTCAVWIGHLLQSNDAIPLIAEADGEIIGEAEVFIGDEPEPFGHHINISTLVVRRGFPFEEVAQGLVDYIDEMAHVLDCGRITLAYPAMPRFFEEIGFERLIARHSIRMPAEEGRVFYKAQSIEDDSPERIALWYMGAGRFQNAREEWERMYWHIWRGVPQLVEAQWHRLSIDLTGQPTLVHLHQHDDAPHSAALRIWTKFPISSHVLSAVKDRAARLGYSQLTTIVDSVALPLFKDAEISENEQWLYTRQSS